MAEGNQTLIVVLAGLGLLIAAITLVIPWWTVDQAAQAGSSTAQDSSDVKPFDDGDGTAESSGVLAVGVLHLVAILAAAGGLVLWWQGLEDEDAMAPGAWLILGGGVLFLIGAIVAVVTWPSGDLGFWDSMTATSGQSSAQIQTAASIGWYLALVAGGLVSMAGLMSSLGDDASEA